jgi:hypothetical protein
MGGSAFVLVAGLVVVWRGGEVYGPYGWFITAIGAISLVINFVMRKQLF